MGVCLHPSTGVWGGWKTSRPRLWGGMTRSPRLPVPPVTTQRAEGLVSGGSPTGASPATGRALSAAAGPPWGDKKRKRRVSCSAKRGSPGARLGRGGRRGQRGAGAARGGAARRFCPCAAALCVPVRAAGRAGGGRGERVQPPALPAPRRRREAKRSGAAAPRLPARAGQGRDESLRLGPLSPAASRLRAGLGSASPAPGAAAGPAGNAGGEPAAALCQVRGAGARIGGGTRELRVRAHP